MNLADMLTYADIGQLTTIASHYACQCKRNSKHDLIQSILVTLNRREFIEQQVNSISVADLRFLNAILFDKRGLFSLEDIIAVVKQTSFDDDNIELRIESKSKETPREAIARYKRSGWLFNGMTSSTKYLFQMPNDLKERFRIELGAALSRQICRTGEPPVYREEQGLCAEDLLLFLRYIKQQSIELNQEFIMYRRTQQQIMDMFHVQESLVVKGGFRFGYGRMYSAYPDRLALLYDYAYQQGYIDENGNMLTLTALGLEVAETGKKENMLHMFRFWLKLYKGAIPNLSSLVYWTSECCRDWVTVSSLHDSLRYLIKPYYYDTAESILNQRVLGMMMHLGLIRIGESPLHGKVIRMTTWGMKLADKSSYLENGLLAPLIDKG
ncbi:hypothetical protein [Paenibacillus pini]|uniref:Helicase XPB/Ssl2 N-terminal domain-containing protein n=1 Tax=Paenibacillus pini JCM 16418 TaxID=1236976 RepID=W7YKR9_9BACL|nr:hypothetical protein [Paenibacillus pini]GAF09077.1 hypothetical protein JCM16418_3195 [Paenibacillus pini JCM 16418]